MARQVFLSRALRAVAAVMIATTTAAAQDSAAGQDDVGGLEVDAAQAADAQRPTLPTDPQQWLNSSPLTYEGIQGKAVLLWYFEETCPSCKKRWPALQALAESYADQPVLFVGVNSGVDPRGVAAYAKQQKIDWPMIVDSDRSFEAASGVKPINLQNILQVRVILPSGEFDRGRWRDLPGTVDRIVADAAWSQDYAALPSEFLPLVRRMEFGDYQPLAFVLKYKMREASPEQRTALESLREQVQQNFQEQLAAALTAAPADDPWLQFAAMEEVAGRFAPLDLPDESAAKYKQLKKDPVVKQELLVAKAIAANAPGLSSPNERIRNRSVSRLQGLVERFPETHGAQRAQELLGE